jgi:Mrp family chromosome partitioning ATPase/capsular polysaccharide biosynthesis protein
MDAPRPVSYDMSHYFSMLRRHWWIIALFTVVGIVGGLGLAGMQQKVYQSTTYVLVMPTGTSSAAVAGGRTSGSVNLDTEAQLVTSAEVAADAAKLLKVGTAPGDLAAAVTVDVPANTSVMAITFDAGTPTFAQMGSHAFATAYLDNRQGSAQSDLTGQSNAIIAKINQQQSSLTKINNELAGFKPGSARYSNLQSERQTLMSQVNTLTNRLNDLSTTTVTSGKIITDAGLPTRPIKPSVPLFLTSGAMLGILIGVALAIGRQRADKRVRFPTDVPRRSGLPLLAQLPTRVKPRFDDVFPPYGTGGRTFNRLRNEVLASLRESDQVIVVTGASKGSASTLVAANLASALARAGSEVVLVCAHLPESIADAVSATRMLGVAATPGLSDVLAGKVPLETATQRAPRNPWLRVITTGGTASATGFLQSQTLRDILAQLRTQAEYIVIEAPSTANSADAQSLASLADAAIIVVEMRRTTHAEVEDAADQLRRVTTSMLGSFVLPRLKRSGNDVPTPPPAGRPIGAGVLAADGPYVESMPTTPMSSVRDGGPRQAQFEDTALTPVTPAAGAQNSAIQNGGTQNGNHVNRASVGTGPVDHRSGGINPAGVGSPHNGQVSTAAQAAHATSAAASGTADSFFTGPDLDPPTASARRRILPGRRSPIRTAPSRRPSPQRPGEDSDATVMFDAPAMSGAARAEGARADAARAEQAQAQAEAAVRAEAARVEAARADGARVEAARVEAARAENARLEAGRLDAGRLDAGRLDRAGVDADRPDRGRPENGRSVDGLTPAYVNQVTGAFSKIPTNGNVGNPNGGSFGAGDSGSGPANAGHGGSGNGGSGNGASGSGGSSNGSSGNTGPGNSAGGNLAGNPAVSTGGPAGGDQGVAGNGVAKNVAVPGTRTVPSVQLPDSVINKPPVNPTSITSPVLGATSIVVKPGGSPAGPQKQTQMSATPMSGSPMVGDQATIRPRDERAGNEAKSGIAVGSKRVPGSAPAGSQPGGEPQVGTAGDTVVFKRIDLVYVEDGDGDGAVR